MLDEPLDDHAQSVATLLARLDAARKYAQMNDAYLKESYWYAMKGTTSPMPHERLKYGAEALLAASLLLHLEQMGKSRPPPDQGVRRLAAQGRSHR